MKLLKSRLSKISLSFFLLVLVLTFSSVSNLAVRAYSDNRYSVLTDGVTVWANNSLGVQVYTGNSLYSCLNVIFGLNPASYVSIIGNYTLSHEVLLPSFSSVWLEGSIYTNFSAWSVFRNANSPASNIAVCGGSYHRISGSVDQVIGFWNCSNCKVYNVGFYGYYNASNVDLRTSQYCEVCNNVFWYGAGAVGCNYRSHDNLISGNYAYNMSGGVVFVVSGSAGASYCNTIMSNWVFYSLNGGLGISFDQGSYGNIASFNHVYWTDKDGINCEDYASGNLISSNYLYGCRVALVSSSNTSCCLYDIVSENYIYCYNVTTVGIFLNNSRYAQILNNRVFWASFKAYQEVGSSGSNVLVDNQFVPNLFSVRTDTVVSNSADFYLNIVVLIAFAFIVGVALVGGKHHRRRW